MKNHIPRIVFGNGKGGVGKSTVTLVTAVAFALGDYRVGYRDTDSQHSLSSMLQLAPFKGLPIFASTPASESTYDLILVDGPPSTNEPEFLDEFDRCDLLCLVTGPAFQELQTTAFSYKALRERRPDAQIRLLVNGYDPRRRLDRQLEENLTAAHLDDVPRLRHYLQRRELYRHFVYAGWNGVARDYSREEIKAAQDETAAVAAEIYGLARNARA